MIARYTRPEWAASGPTPTNTSCWLTVEIAASQALAKFGLVPQSAADAIRDKRRLHRRPHQRDRSRGPSRRHRLHHHRRRAHQLPRRLPLAPLRPHQHRRSRHRAVPPTQRSLRHHPRRHRSPLRNPQKARHRVQAHPHHRPHPRHPRRTLHLRPQAPPLVLRDAAQPHPLRRRRRRPPRRQALRSRRHLRPPQARARRGNLCRTRSQTRRGRDTSSPARPPRRLRLHPRRPGQHLRQDSHRDPPPPAHRGPRSRRVLQRKTKGLQRHAPQAQPHHLASKSPASPESSAPTPRSPSKT